MSYADYLRDYLKWAQDTYREERALIEKLGLLSK